MYEIDINMLKNSITAASNNLSNNKAEVNNLNVFPVPDGDTGTNMNMTIKSALKVANESEANSIKSFMQNYSKGSLLGARGNSGVILSQLIRGFVEAIPSDLENMTTTDLVKCLVRSSEVAYNAVMKPTEGTILTVAKDMAKASKKFPKNNKNVIEFLDFIYREGEKSLDRTPELLPILKESGVVDAGGKGLLCLFEGAISYLKGNESLLFEKNEEIQNEDIHFQVEKDIDFGYCTEFIINLQDEIAIDVEKELKKNFSEMGDSIIVVRLSDIIKVHFHTNNPGLALEKALEFGELSDIKIDNMRVQHNEKMFSKEEYIESVSKSSMKENNNEFYNNAFISVSAGEGFDEIFESLNVAKIIHGGQTMNPSTEDILSAVEEVNAENIFILPNNSNIILSAEQVKSLTNKNVYVIPTKSMPEGISAIFAGMNDEDPMDILNNSKIAISSMKTGEVTYAIRGTTFNGEDIEEGSILGISGKNIISKGNSLHEVTTKLIDCISNDEYSLLSVYYGKDVSEEEALGFQSLLEEKYPYLDVELVYGGQPLYYFIISLE